MKIIIVASFGLAAACFGSVALLESPKATLLTIMCVAVAVAGINALLDDGGEP